MIPLNVVREHAQAPKHFSTPRATVRPPVDVLSVDCAAPGDQQIFLLKVEPTARRSLEVNAVVPVIGQLAW